MHHTYSPIILFFSFHIKKMEKKTLTLFAGSVGHPLSSSCQMFCPCTFLHKCCKMSFNISASCEVSSFLLNCMWRQLDLVSLGGKQLQVDNLLKSNIALELILNKCHCVTLDKFRSLICYLSTSVYVCPVCVTCLYHSDHWR